MPVLNPAEIWQRTGRYGIDELFKLKDRKGADMVLAMTHEEIVTTHVAQVVRSYRDLPLILYHFQIKERDEPRPRAGVLRTREFIMKDSYTFDRDAAGPRRRLREAPRGLRQDLRPLRAGVVPGRLRRRDDGRHRRARVHGAVPGGRERRRAGAGLRRQRRGRERDAEAGRAAARRSTRRSRSPRPGLTTVAQVCRGARRARRRADQGLPDHRRRGRAAARARARRPPRQRHQARQHARRALPARARDGVRGPHRAGGLHRAGRHRRPDPARLGARRRQLHLRRQHGRRAPARRQAGPRLRLHRGRRAHGRGGGHRRRARDPDRARDRDRQHLQARHALLGAARARPTWTSRARPSRSGWAPTASGRRASRPPRSSSSPTRRASPGRARWRRSTCTSSGSASPAPTSSRWPRSSTRSCARLGLDVIYDDRTLGPGREVRRRRAARRAAAADGRPAHARGGRDRGPGPARARDPSIPLEGAAQAAADLWATLP